MKILSVKATAKLLGCHPDTVRTYVAEGKLTPLYEGQVFLFDAREVLRLPAVKRGRPRKRG